MIISMIVIFFMAYLFNVKMNCLLKYITDNKNCRLQNCLFGKWGILIGCLYMCLLAILLFFTHIPEAYVQLTDFMLSLVLIAIIDAKFHIIPNIMMITMMITQLLCSFLLVKSGISYVNLIVAVVLAIVLLLISKISKEQIGAGDVKLLIVISLIYGLSFTIYSMIFSLIIMVIFSVPLLIMKKATLKSQIPFVPFYVIGALAYILINL